MSNRGINPEWPLGPLEGDSLGIARVRAKGQLTIPIAARRFLDIQEGDVIDISCENPYSYSAEIVIRVVERKAKSGL